MSVYDEGKKRLTNLLQWRETQEYHSICAYNQAECERLINIGKEYMIAVRGRESIIKGNAIRVEYATFGDIHRGFYCPSPVLDIIIGNVTRGRLLKKVNSSSKINYRYGFDKNNDLIYVETLQEDEITSTEFIMCRGNTCLGISINADFELEAVSEEVFESNKLVRYSYVSVYPDQHGYFCDKLHVETYSYDDQGLASSEKRIFHPYVSTFQKYRYNYVRKDGYISSYTVKECFHDKDDEETVKSPIYTVRKKRKA